MMKNMSGLILLTTVAVNTRHVFLTTRACVATLGCTGRRPRLRPPSGTLDFQAAFCSVLAFYHAVLKI